MYVLDVSDEQSVIDMTAHLVNELGRIDYAVNCAGSLSCSALFYLSVTDIFRHRKYQHEINRDVN